MALEESFIEIEGTTGWIPNKLSRPFFFPINIQVACEYWGANCAKTDVGSSFWVSNCHHKPHTSATI